MSDFKAKMLPNSISAYLSISTTYPAAIAAAARVVGQDDRAGAGHDRRRLFSEQFSIAITDSCSGTSDL